MLSRVILTGALLLSCLLSFSQIEKNDSLQFTTYYFENGGKSSEGYLRDGKPDGYWKSFYRNGTVKAEGNRKKFQLDGPWTFYTAEGEKTVEINYSQNKKNGLQKTFKGGKVIKEEPYADDKIQGFVRHYFFPDGELQMEVPYVDSQANGAGYEYNKTGMVITLLTYKDGVLTKKQNVNRTDEQEQKQGIWMTFFPNRSVQSEGPYVNDLKHGYWKFYTQKGDLKRVEKWIMGVLQEGASEVAKIEIRREIDPQTGKLSFKGSYRNGIPEGVHRQYNEDGEVIASKIYKDGKVLYEGIVDEEGRKQGSWKWFFETGELKARGSYKDNFKIGKWEYYYRDGRLEQSGSYMRGLPDGLWTWLYENGQTWREEEYAMGEEDGPSVEYSDSGTVIAQGNYIEGLKEGKWIFEMNDHREEGEYFEGERKGKWEYYYRDSEKLSFEGEYENGQENGTHIYYYPDGKVKRRGNYSAGVKTGLWEYFNEDGARIITIEYEDGREVKYNGEKIKYGRRLDKELERERAEEESDQS